MTERTDEKNESGDFFGFAENASMKALGRSSVHEIIKSLPVDSKEAYLEALEKAPELVEMESPIIRFLRVENYNPWAAAQRLLRYWAFRKSIFGERAFLPLDLTGNGAMTFADIAHLNGGRQTMLPNDDHGRVVFCLDHSKNVAVTAEHYPRTRFFLLHAMSENPTCQRDGAVFFIILNNPTGALFDASEMVKAAKLISQVLPMKLYKVHILCCPPAAGGEKYAETFVPIVLKNIGTFFSDKATVHVADTEAGLLTKLQPFGLRQENLPSFVGGTWEYGQFIQWQQQRGLIVRGDTVASVASIASPTFSEKDSHLANIIKETLANYSAKLQEMSSLGDEPAQIDDEPYSKIPWNANSELVEMQPVELTAVEKDAALRDIYGSVNVPFTITKQVREEGCARAQLHHCITSMAANENSAYQEAVRRVPDLVELESDPLRFLSRNNMDPQLSAKYLVLYWKKRKALFGDRAFLPLRLRAKSALSDKAVDVLDSGWICILPHDTKGRIVLMFNRSRLSEQQKLYPVKDLLQAAFYMLSLTAEREESRQHGAVGVNVVEPGQNTPSLASGLLDLMSCGAIPLRGVALHVMCPGRKSTFVQRSLSLMLRPLTSWFYVSQRVVVHTFEKDQDMVSDLTRYGFKRGGIPEFLGGSWQYDTFFEFMKKRVLHEKTLHSSAGDDQLDCKPPAKSSSPKRRAKRQKIAGGKVKGDGGSEEDPAAILAKKRRMEVIYGRRKRERLRIEVEVMQDQCKEYGDKNERLGADNQMLEGLIVAANAEVARYARLYPMGARDVGTPTAAIGTGAIAVSFSVPNQGIPSTASLPQQSFVASASLPKFTNQDALQRYQLAANLLTSGGFASGSALPSQEQLLYQQLTTAARGIPLAQQQSLPRNSADLRTTLLHPTTAATTLPLPPPHTDPRLRGPR